MPFRPQPPANRLPAYRYRFSQWLLLFEPPDPSPSPTLPITIRPLTTLADFQDCVRLQEETWGAGFSERVPSAILRVGQLIGGVTAGAFDGDRMVGFVFGLTGVRDGELVHWSDMLAVREAYRSQHVGQALKAYQRERVRALGVRVMLWTYDPLVARNAYFNICRLGARPTDYVPDMYGSNTGSALHGALPTDRFIVRWDLDAASPIQATSPGEVSLPLVDPLDAHGGPTFAGVPNAPAVRVQIPSDVDTLRQHDPRALLAWRLTVREAVTALLARGYRVSGFSRSHGGDHPWYVFTRADAPGTAATTPDQRPNEHA